MLSLPALAQDFTYTYKGKTLNYTVIDENARTCKTKAQVFSTSSGNNVSGNLIIPETAINDGKEYTVTTIGSGSFYKCTGLISVELPYTITNFDRSAFEGCTGLNSLTIPQNVANIGRSAFQGCTGLTSLIIPQCVSAIDEYAFNNCNGLKTVIITGTATVIHTWGAFNGCSGLIKAAYPDKISNPFPSSCAAIPLPANYIMEDGVIYGPEKKSVIYVPLGLEKFTIPASVTSIGNNAFYRCSKLTSIIIPDAVTSIGNSAFQNCSGLTSIAIPEALTSIGNSAFQNCSGLTSVKLGGSVTTIGNSSFQGCSGLTSIVIPKAVTSIGSSAFSGCSGINSVTSFANVPPTMADNSFEGIYDTATLLAPDESYLDTNWSQFKNVYISFYDGILNYVLKPDQEDGADNTAGVIPGDYSGLTEVTIPYRINVEKKDGTYVRYIVDEIGDNAFNDCSLLKAIGFNSRSAVRLIGANAFAGTGITSVTLPATVGSIGDNAFMNTISLTEISLPSSLKTIGTDAFRGSNCSKVNISDIKAWCGIDFANEYANPLSSGTLYLNGEKVTAITIPNLTPEVKKYAFYNAADITSVTFGNGVTSVGEKAFANCTGMTEVVMAPSTETIGASAFAGDTNLATIVMSHGMKTIGEKAFDGCAATTVSITAQTPPAASNNSFSHYTGKFFVQGEQASDAYFDAYVCWDRFDPQLLTEPTDMEIDCRSISGKPGDTFRLTATLQPSDVSLPQIFWRSTNPEIASVDENGLVTIHQATGDVTPAAENTEAAGTCRIIAESLYADGPVAEVEVNVKVTGIDNVFGDETDEIDFTAPLEIYTLQGIMTTSCIANLPTGIYIVRQGDKVKKIAVR